MIHIQNSDHSMTLLHSIIRYGLAAWYGSATVQLRAKVTNMIKTAMKVIGKSDYQSLQIMYKKVVGR